MEGLAAANAGPDTVMIDTTYFETPSTASSLWVETEPGRLIGRTKGDINTKAPCHHRCERLPVALFHDGGPGQRLCRRGSAARRQAQRAMAAR